MSDRRHFDYIIVGAGPAGLQLGYYLQQTGKNYVILERGSTAGTFFKTFPRHRTLISINKVHTGQTNPEINLRVDWNSLLSDSDAMLFRQFSQRYFPPADQMVSYLEAYAAYYNINIQYGVEITRISKDKVFRLQSKTGKILTCAHLIIATGFSKPFIPHVPGIYLAENYTEVSVEPDEFANQRVLIIGKGNSAFETANNLVESTASIHLVSPNPLSMAWNTRHAGDLRAINNTFLDTDRLRSQNNILEARVARIERNNKEYKVSFSFGDRLGKCEDISYDRVIVCTGFRFDTSIFDSTCRIELVHNDRLPAQTGEWESTNVEGLYFAGTLMQARDHKGAASGFIHGFRYNVRAQYHILDRKYNGSSWPSQTVGTRSEELAEAIIQRIYTNSDLWHQRALLCDLLVISNHAGEAKYYSGIPVAYVRNFDMVVDGDYYLITIEYHQHRKDTIAGSAWSYDRRQEHTNLYLQDTGYGPVIRRYKGKDLISEYCFLADLTMEWRKDEHIKELRSMFLHSLGEL